MDIHEEKLSRLGGINLLREYEDFIDNVIISAAAT
jgi:hypothetical protein